MLSSLRVSAGPTTIKRCQSNSATVGSGKPRRTLRSNATVNITLTSSSLSPLRCIPTMKSRQARSALIRTLNLRTLLL
eukprot:2032541-Pleurochrysis_carterae.AAC.4